MALQKRAQYGVVFDRIVEIWQVPRGMDHGALRARRLGGQCIRSLRALRRFLFSRYDEHRYLHRAVRGCAGWKVFGHRRLGEIVAGVTHDHRFQQLARAHIVGA